jgi:hypothetical protein
VSWWLLPSLPPHKCSWVHMAELGVRGGVGRGMAWLKTLLHVFWVCFLPVPALWMAYVLTGRTFSCSEYQGKPVRDPVLVTGLRPLVSLFSSVWLLAPYEDAACCRGSSGNRVALCFHVATIKEKCLGEWLVTHCPRRKMSVLLWYL